MAYRARWLAGLAVAAACIPDVEFGGELTGPAAATATTTTTAGPGPGGANPGGSGPGGNVGGSTDGGGGMGGDGGSTGGAGGSGGGGMGGGGVGGGGTGGAGGGGGPVGPCGPILHDPAHPQLSAGYYHACNIVDGSLWCWGGNGVSTSVLGQEVGPNTSPIPLQADIIDDACEVETGWFSTVVIRSDGSVWRWGSNNGTERLAGYDGPKPTQLGSIADAVDVSLTLNHGCIVHQTGTVSCWGENDVGQVDGTAGAHLSVPTQVHAAVLDQAIVVATGDDHTCALESDGSVWCWGANDDGQLGDGTTNPPVTQPVSTIDLINPTTLVAWTNSTCALDDVGVKCWGGSFPDSPAGQMFSANGSYVALADSHECFIANGLYCQGNNNWGEVGNGNSGQSVNSFTLVDPGGTPVAVTAGAQFTCVRLDDDSVRCVGADENGTLGRGCNGAGGGGGGFAHSVQWDDVCPEWSN